MIGRVCDEVCLGYGKVEVEDSEKVPFYHADVGGREDSCDGRPVEVLEGAVVDVLRVCSLDRESSDNERRITLWATMTAPMKSRSYTHFWTGMSARDFARAI